MDKVNVMDLSVDVLNHKMLSQKIEEYFQEERVHSIIMLTDEVLEKATDDEKYHGMLSNFSMCLPAAEEVLVDCHLDFFKNRGILTDYQSFYAVLECLEKIEKTIYVVGNDLKQMEQFQQFCEQSYGKLKIKGVCYKDDNMKDETIVNDINTILPDAIIVAMSSPEQEKWMTEQGQRLAVKLCIGTGSALPDIISCCDSTKKKRRKWKLYRQLENAKRNIQKFWHRRIMKEEYEYYIYKREKAQLKSRFRTR